MTLPSSSPMFYAGTCRICQAGPLGLRTCGGCESVVLLCDECDSVWAGADTTGVPDAVGSEQLLCPRCGESLYEGQSHWSTLAEISACEWTREAIEAGELEIESGEAAPPAPNELEDDV